MVLILLQNINGLNLSENFLKCFFFKQCSEFEHNVNVNIFKSVTIIKDLDILP